MPKATISRLWFVCSELDQVYQPKQMPAFIKDFAPDYSSFTSSTIPIVNGVFSLNLATDPAAGRHVQYGFETVGPNVWVTDVASKGFVQITAVPEPSTSALAGLGASALLAIHRRQK